MINVFEIKQEQHKQNIQKINQLMEKKNASIRTLQQYAASYADKLDDLLSTTVPIIRNNQLFYRQLQQVIHDEKKELDKLQGIKADLIRKYLDLDAKARGLDAMHEDVLHLQRIARDNAEESERFDQLITRTGMEKKWEN